MTRRSAPYKIADHLTVKETIRVRFNETDPLGIVWHGNYLTYFEDGREAFGRKHGFSYLDIKDSGYTTPIVMSHCEHKRMVRYGELITISTQIVATPAAKIILIFEIINQAGEIVCMGETNQVFVDTAGNLSLTNPTFYEVWKEKVGLIC